METVDLFLPSDKPSDYLEVDNAWVYEPDGSPITNREIVYTPMSGSPKIIVKFYKNYAGSPKHNRNTRY